MYDGCLVVTAKGEGFSFNSPLKLNSRKGMVGGKIRREYAYKKSSICVICIPLEFTHCISTDATLF